MTPNNNYAANTAFGSISFDNTAGAFVIGGNAITLTGAITNNDADLQTINLALILNGTRTMNAASGSITIGGVISQSGGAQGLTKTGGNILLLSGANTYTGATTVSAGTLKAGVASVANTSGAFGNNSAVTMANAAGATLDITGFNTQIGSLTGGGGAGGNVTLGAATLTVGGNNTSPAAYAGVISGSGGALTKTGTGTLTLTGASTYSGATTVNGGTLALGTGGALTTTSGVAINSGGTLLLNASNAVNSAATVAMNSGTLTLATTNGITQTFGTLTLTGNSIIDFGALTGTNSLHFAAGLGGAGTLAVYNWTAANDNLFFGTSNSALSAAELGRITFFSGAGTGFLGTAAFNPANGGLMGEVSPVPEPSAVLVGLSLLSLVGFRERRWFLRCREARAPGAA